MFKTMKNKDILVPNKDIDKRITYGAWLKVLIQENIIYEIEGRRINAFFS